MLNDISRHIVEELRRESAAASQRNKLLESENKLLISETDQLRDVSLSNPEMTRLITHRWFRK